MDAKAFIGVILLLVGVYTISLAFEFYEFSFIPNEWVIGVSGAIVVICSFKYFKPAKSSNSASDSSSA